MIRDKVLNLPTVPLSDATADGLQSLGLKELAKVGERTIYQGPERSSAIFFNGKLSSVSDGQTPYTFGYNDKGQLTKLESSSHKFELIDGAWQKSHAGGVEKLPKGPVLSRLGNGRLQLFDQ